MKKWESRPTCDWLKAFRARPCVCVCAHAVGDFVCFSVCARAIDTQRRWCDVIRTSTWCSVPFSSFARSGVRQYSGGFDTRVTNIRATDVWIECVYPMHLCTSQEKKIWPIEWEILQLVYTDASGLDQRQRVREGELERERDDEIGEKMKRTKEGMKDELERIYFFYFFHKCSSLFSSFLQSLRHMCLMHQRELNTDKRHLFYLEELIPFVCIRLQNRDDHPMHCSIGVSAIRMRRAIIYFNFFLYFNFLYFCFVLKSTCDNFNCFRISKMANPDGKCAQCVCAVCSRTMWCNGARFCL